jgi:Bax protein
MRLFLYLVFFISMLQAEKQAPEYSVSEVPKKMSVKTKKARFYALLLPPITKVYDELDAQYKMVQKELEDTNATTQNSKILALKKEYNAKTDKELLKALKPHPKSIAIAQAAMESAWGTSRFFREANNVYGMWNNSKSAKRIAASQQREGKRTIWLSKYDNLEESVRAYYKTLAKGKTYKAFREVKYNGGSVYDMVKKLDKYSERGEAYIQEIASMIRYNKLTKYD